MGYFLEQQTGNLPSNMGRDWRMFVSVFLDMMKCQHETWDINRSTNPIAMKCDEYIVQLIR
jgi:hypothetical protein